MVDALAIIVDNCETALHFLTLKQEAFATAHDCRAIIREGPTEGLLVGPLLCLLTIYRLLCPGNIDLCKFWILVQRVLHVALKTHLHTFAEVFHRCKQNFFLFLILQPL